MKKISYGSLRENLDEILKLAEPILKQKKLIDELHKRICEWQQDFHHWFCNEPELECCRNVDCENCPRSECPEMRKKSTFLRWGPNSLNEITKLIGEYDMYAYGRKEYKNDE